MSEKIRLQERDVELLRALKKYELMTTKQIQKLFFKDIKKTTMLRRLRLLMENKYIKQAAILDDYGRTWILSERSSEVLDNPKLYDFRNRNTIYHDTLVTELRLRFKSLGLGFEWMTANEIKAESSFKGYRSHRQIIPDGVMIEPVSWKLKAISIELELTVKSLKRYHDILGNYCSNDSVSYVWYFVKDRAALDRIINLKKMYRFYFDKVWFSFIDQALNEAEIKIYICKHSKWFSLNDIAFSNYKKPAHEAIDGVSTLEGSKVISVNNAKPSESQILENKKNKAVSCAPVPDHTPPTLVDCGQELELERDDMS